MSKQMKKIMLVEDDLALSNGIVMVLQGDDISVTQCFNLKTAREKIEKETYDLVILDINLPDGNGLEFLIEVKKSYSVPVILLTANDLEMDIVTGLEMGADDYITKPFSLAIFRARVNTQLRKSEGEQWEKTGFRQGDFAFDFERMEFQKNGASIELSKTEQKLLRLLVQNKGITLERGRLVDCIWTDGAEYVDENALSVAIKRLRDKLEDDPKKPEYIKTVYGIGYTWEGGR